MLQTLRRVLLARRLLVALWLFAALVGALAATHEIEIDAERMLDVADVLRAQARL